MRRVAVVFLCVLMTVTLLSACGSSISIQDEWSKLILGDKLPVPQKGKLDSGSNLDNIFMGGIKKVDEDYYAEYKDACIEMGYTIDSEESGNRYTAFNADAYKVSLSFYSDKISITLNAPEQLGKFTWPTTGIGSKLPVPASDLGKATIDTSKSYKVIIGNTTHDGYNNYVSACEGNGFNVDHSKQDDRYEAKNAEGYRLVVSYIGCNRIEVMIQTPKEDTTSVTINDSATQSTETSSGNTNVGISKDFKDAMDSYEKFMDEYVAFMKKYKSNPSDLSLLTDYANYMSKYADFVEDFEKWEDEEMNAAETAYYIDVQARVSKKLLEAAQ